MGTSADMLINGDMCEQCGEFFDIPTGIPSLCGSCDYHNNASQMRKMWDSFLMYVDIYKHVAKALFFNVATFGAYGELMDRVVSLATDVHVLHHLAERVADGEKGLHKKAREVLDSLENPAGFRR